MSDDPTTVAMQRILDALAGDTPPEPIVRELLDRAVRRLHLLSGAMLHRGYPRLTQPPLNLQTDELLGGVVAALIAALRQVRPRTPREFFGLAAQHMRWQLNDLARLLDKQSAVLELDEVGVPAPPSSGSALTPDARRMLEAIDGLPEDEREVFNLIRIQGLTYPEAAGVIGVSVKTVQRRLNRARLLLAERLDDLRPGLEPGVSGQRPETGHQTSKPADSTDTPSDL
jgi:RNA polymerase sigma-70 factor (ECF subfamily)